MTTTTNWRAALPLLDGHGLALIPIGAKAPERKAPVDPATGYGLRDWQHSTGYSVSALAGMNPAHVIAVGVNTGHGGILVLDIDGASAADWCRQRGPDPATAATWHINRNTDPSRYKLVFRLTPEQQQAFSQTKLLLRTTQGEALEIYYQPGAQVLVLGEHCKSGGMYGWVNGPADIAPPTAEWMEIFQAIQEKVQELRGKGDPSRPPRVKGVSSAAGKWEASGPGRPCPICGRERSAACTWLYASGRRSASCFHGSGDLLCPQNLKPGEVITGHDGGRWAFVRTYIADCLGEKSLFVDDQPKPSRTPATPTPQPMSLSRQPAVPLVPPTPAQLDIPAADAFRRDIKRHLDEGQSGVGADFQVLVTDLANSHGLLPFQAEAIIRELRNECESELQKKAESLEIRESLASQKARAEFKLGLMLPAPIATALATVTQTLPTDDLCTAMAFLAAASGTFKIGTTLCANVLSNYKVPLNLFVVLVAPSGKKKSPVLRAACRDPWEWVRADAAAANRQAREDWEAACEGVTRNDRPDRPMPVFPFITGATGEALSQQFGVHEDDPRRMGILLFKDELSSFFTGLDAYRSGSKKCDQASILEAFEGTGCTELRATKESRMFERCHLSILGGIQPAIFEQQVAHKGDPDGFFARFLYARLPQVSKRMPLHASAEQVAELHRQEDYLKGIMLRLYKLPPTKLVLSDKAMALFVELDYEAQELGGMAASDTAEGPVYGKRCANVARVAGVLHMLKIAAGTVADDDVTVDVDTYLMARDIVLHLQQYAITQQRRIASNASPDTIDSTLRLVHRLAQAIGKPVSPGEIRQRLSPSQRKTLSSQDIQGAFRELESIGFGSICPGPRSAPQFLASGQLPVL